MHWEMKGHWSHVNLVKREFLNANEKSVLQSLNTGSLNIEVVAKTGLYLQDICYDTEGPHVR